MLICSKCNPPVQFTLKWSLKRHIASKHEVEEYKCSICQRSFCRKDNYQRHMYKHKTNEDEFVCWSCGQKFVRKDIMLRHVQNIHVIKKNELHGCETCGRKFSTLQYLRIHAKCVHNQSSKKQKSNLTVNKCIICSTFFDYKSDLFVHYDDAHGYKIETDTLMFENINEFHEWKRQMEINTRNFYCKQEKRKKSDQIVHYICSHKYRKPVALRDKNKKNEDSKQLEASCPSEINLTVCNDNTCKVKFLKTHIGHRIKSRLVTRTKVANSAKNYAINGDMFSKVLIDVTQSFFDIQNSSAEENHFAIKEHNSNSNVYCNSENCLDTNDLNCDKVKKLQANHDNIYSSSILNVTTYVQNYKEFVLYYKGKNEIDSDYPSLTEEDFVIITMNAEQKAMLEKHGNDIITMDCTHLGEFDVTLHSLIIIDSSHKGFPCCFMFCNKNKEIFVDIMLSRIRDIVGVIKAKVFISSVQYSYYDSWRTLMAVPRYRLFCSWNVKNTWRKHLRKITCADKRESVKKILFNLQEETKVNVFESKLKNFLRTQDTDVLQFVKYFKKYFVSNKKCWAHCYRNYAGINTNKHVNYVYMLIKRVFSEKVHSFQDVLERLNEYISNKKKKSGCSTRKKDKLSTELIDIQKRHKKATQISIANIRVCDDSWLVPSSNKKAKKTLTYTVKRMKFMCKDCQLICDECKTCVHQFKCSCSDSFIKNNMCVHIHALCIALVNHEVMFTPFSSDNFKFDSNIEDNKQLLRKEEITTDLTDISNIILKDSPSSTVSEDSWVPYEICEIEQIHSENSVSSIDSKKSTETEHEIVESYDIGLEEECVKPSQFQQRLQRCRTKLLQAFTQVSTIEDIEILEEVVGRLKSTS